MMFVRLLPADYLNTILDLTEAFTGVVMTEYGTVDGVLGRTEHNDEQAKIITDFMYNAPMMLTELVDVVTNLQQVLHATVLKGAAPVTPPPSSTH